METSIQTYTPPVVPDNCSIIHLPARNLDATVERELSLRRVRVIEVLNPFRPDERNVTEVEALDNESLGALLARAEYAVERFEASINGERVDSSEVWRTVVSAGQEVVLYPRTGGSSLRSFALMLPLIAIALITGIGVPFIGFGAMMSLGATATNILAAAVAIGGSMLVSWALRPGTPHQPAFSSTYDPSGPRGLAAPGTPVPKGKGKMGWCGNIISSFVDFDGPQAYIYALACYGFGRATSVGNILLNGKPISEYQNCRYEVRLGHNDQTPIDGFNRTVNGYPQQSQMLVSNGPITVPGTGTNVQGVQVTVKFPSGLYRVTDKGNYVPLKLIYTIKISPHGQNAWTEPLFPNFTKSIATTHADGSQTWPAWVVVPTDRFAGSGIVYAYDNGSHTPGDPWTQSMRVSTVNIDGSTSDTNGTFTGKWMPCDPSLEQMEVETWQKGYRVVKNDTLNAFFDTTTIYGLSSGRWDVQVAKVGYQGDKNDNPYLTFADSTEAKLVCDVWLWNVNEITLSDLSYPNMILVGVQALATSQMSGANLQVQATIQHDLGEDTALPYQLAGFAHDNPAVVAYDVLTNPLYGMGLSASLIDVPAFVAWAEFCDELVTNQDGSTVRRFIFNGVFDQAGDAWKVLQTIGNMSRAAVIQIGMRYSVVLDAPALPVQLFTVGNTKRNSFQESWISLDDRASLIECDFADAARNYRMDLPVSVMTAADLNSGLTPKPSRTKLIGCTSRDQAWRWAYFHLLSTKLSLRFIQFEAAIEACCCRMGSVIAVQTDVTQWASGGRILDGSTLSTVNVDRCDLTYADSQGYTVSVQHPVIRRGTATVQNITGLTVTMTAALPARRALKAVGPDGKEYVLTGAQGSAITVASSTGTLAPGQVVTLYDVNVIEQLQVTAYTVNPDGSATLRVFGNFQAVPTADCAWAYGQSAGYQPAKLFRVTNMRKSGDFNFQISAVEYNDELYTDVVPNYGEIIGVPDTTPAILNLSLTEQFQNGTFTGSKDSALVCVGWMNSNTAVGARVEVQNNGGAWSTLGNIQGQGCTFVGTVGNTYTVRVTGFDWANNLLGNPVSASITVVASGNAPADVTNFTGLASSGQTVLTWSAAAGADHYEIRYTGELGGAGMWDTAEVLWDGNGTTWTDHAVRSGIYFIVAVSSLATGSVESVNPATWQNSGVTGGAGINPNSINPTTVVWPMCGVNIGAAGGTLLSLSPYGLGINRQGAQVNIPNQNISITFAGPLAANTTYYAYFYLDTNLNLQCPNGNSVDVGYSNAHASTAVSNGVLAWYYAFTTDSAGHANNPEMDVHTISL